MTSPEPSVRPPAVAGQFYPASERSLRAQVEGFLVPSAASLPVLGAVMPHAGYVYSGAVAGETASALEVPGRVLLLGPNHTGWGPPVSLYAEGEWLMPFGSVAIDGDLAARLLEAVPMARPDRTAHLREHSLEVQLPFLHYRRGKPFTFVPMALSSLSPADCERVGKGVAGAISAAGGGVLMVASSDMTHYESADSARRKDRLAIERILALDPAGLLSTVAGHRITMCGILPTAVMLHAALALGATRARLVRYATSGEVSGDFDQVVGYAGIVVQ